MLDGLTLRAGVENLTDDDPPLIPSSIAANTTPRSTISWTSFLRQRQLPVLEDLHDHVYPRCRRTFLRLVACLQ